MRPRSRVGRALFALGVTVVVTGASLVVIGIGIALWIASHQYQSPQSRAGAAPAADAASASASSPESASGPGGSARRVAPVADNLDWRDYGADPGHSRHAAIDQITPANVGGLRETWQYRTGEVERRGRWAAQGKVQATPIIAAGSLVFCTPFSRAIALDPASGVERWVYEPGNPADPAMTARTRLPGERFNCRGLAQWRDPAAAASTPTLPCVDRVFLPTTDRRLIALDARTGRPCEAFGDEGAVQVSLDAMPVGPDELQFASAPTVVGDVVVIGSASGDNQRAAGIPGAVHAFDARTGVERWRFEPLAASRGAAEGDPRLHSGQANVWGSISADPARGLVFLPTSSPSPDYYGGLRPGDNRDADSIVALDAATGAIRWQFQTVHHDLWDYDVPAAPTLFDWRTPEGRLIPALVFATKTGFVFVLDRLTGAPLTRVEERPVPPSDVPGEQAAPTQPFSVGQPVLSPQAIGPGDAFGLVGYDWLACRDAITGAARRDGLFTPPSLGGTLVVPMAGGGANWGGVAIDPATRRVFVNTNNAVQKITLLPADEALARRRADRRADIGLMTGAPYGMVRELLLSPLGLPCNKPPWGRLAAVDIERGALAWQVPLGNTRRLAPFGLSFDWGTATFGGPIVTTGGVLFIASTMDNLIRAFDPRTGAELWAGELPYSAMATPMTYAIGGRQYVVIVAGGHPVLGSRVGDAVVAFALP